MKNHLLILCVCLIGLGCGTGLKSRWGNFTAYYNTYYNAKKSYQAGLEKVVTANSTYNPQQPIRIHEIPINVGLRDFEKAINKGAEILRKHGDSKWVDNSLNLIGKSYYFRKEYFSADQKFLELVATTDDNRLIQEAVIWRSRVLLEMELYGQGIQYITEQLKSLEGQWTVRNKAELKSILAQYYVVQQNWEQAIIQLNEALPDLASKKYKERGYFLLGQLNERTGSSREAYVAFTEVENHYYDYDLQYLALRKKAETARNLGDSGVALQTFSKMIKDDKNTEFKAELDYEIAKTHQDRKEYQEAEYIYKSILHNTINRPTAETKALAYYGLAEVYRFGYDDLEMAAAYYDTASRQNAALQKLPENFNASELAVSFGEYSRLKKELAFRDSVLWVSSLSQTQLDSLIAEIKKRKLREIEEARQNIEHEQNTLVNITGEETSEIGSNGNGFLNVNNPAAQSNAKVQFQAIWGNRPLVDNWRVQELIVNSGPNQQTINSDINTSQFGGQSTVLDVSVDLSDIPFSEEEKRKVKSGAASFKYELGNLFFISLEMPDSAIIYFQDIIRNHPESEEFAVSLYSLSEAQSILGLNEEAKDNAIELIDRFPGSQYAVPLADKYGIELPKTTKIKDLTLLQQYHKLKADTSLSKSQFAEKSTTLALENNDNIESAGILYEAIQQYILLGKEGMVYNTNYAQLVRLKSDWKQARQEFEQEQKNARALLQDTSVTDLEKQTLQSLIDSTLAEPNLDDFFSYSGENWNKARINIDLFLTNFPNSPLTSQVRILKQELQLPAKKIGAASAPEAEVKQNSETLTCTDLKIEPIIRGGLDTFLANIANSGSVSEQDQKGITYRFLINQRGVVEKYNLVSNSINEDIARAFSEAIDEGLSFEPVLLNGEAIQVECFVTFPIR